MVHGRDSSLGPFVAAYVVMTVAIYLLLGAMEADSVVEVPVDRPCPALILQPTPTCPTSPPARAKKRYALVSLNSPGAHSYHRRSSVWMWPYTVSNRMEYAKLQNYALHVDGPSTVDRRTPPSWSKVKVLRKYLTDYEYVLWVDIDVLFVTHRQKLEWIASRHPNASLIIAKDLNGINCGVMLWRRSSWSFDFLDRLWHFKGNRGHVWQEQYAMMELLRENANDDAKNVAIIPQRELNAYTYNAQEDAARFRDGDLLVHFANCDGRPHTCWAEFQYYLEKAWKNGAQKRSDDELALIPGSFHSE